MDLIKAFSIARKQLGWFAALKLAPAFLLQPLLPTPRERRNVRRLVAKEGFDAQHGTETEQPLEFFDTGFLVNSRRQPVGTCESHRASATFLPLRVLACDLREFVFIDLGCGLGKPLLVASEFPFKKLIGVDISPVAVERTKKNIDAYTRNKSPGDRDRFEAQVGDVLDFEFPNEPTVLYLYNPFHGETLQGVIDRLCDSLRQHPRKVLIIYVGPVFAEVIDARPELARVPTMMDVGIAWATKPTAWAWPRAATDQD